MSSLRLGTSVAIMLAIVAVGVALASLMDSVRDDEGRRGRMFNTGVPVSAANDAVLFAADEFYLVSDGEEGVRALYVYPPGYYGHIRGCRVVWDGRATADGASATGLFLDPCGGARFGRDGTLLAGPADRGLDYFEISRGVNGVVVDTNTLYCGAAPANEDASPTATPEREECDRVHPDE